MVSTGDNIGESSLFGVILGICRLRSGDEVPDSSSELDGKSESESIDHIEEEFPQQY